MNKTITSMDKELKLNNGFELKTRPLNGERSIRLAYEFYTTIIPKLKHELFNKEQQLMELASRLTELEEKIRKIEKKS